MAAKKAEPKSQPKAEPTPDPSDALAECPKCPDGSAKVKIGNLKKHYAEVHGEAEFDLSNKQMEEFKQINAVIQRTRLQYGVLCEQMALLDRQTCQMNDQRSSLLSTYAKSRDVEVKPESQFQWDPNFKTNTIKVTSPAGPPRQNQPAEQ